VTNTRITGARECGRFLLVGFVGRSAFRPRCLSFWLVCLTSA
jgi:hypothetical protein